MSSCQSQSWWIQQPNFDWAFPLCSIHLNLYSYFSNYSWSFRGSHRGNSSSARFKFDRLPICLGFEYCCVIFLLRFSKEQMKDRLNWQGRAWPVSVLETVTVFLAYWVHYFWNPYSQQLLCQVFVRGWLYSYWLT